VAVADGYDFVPGATQDPTQPLADHRIVISNQYAFFLFTHKTLSLNFTLANANKTNR
jgi:hypothetical protein